MGAWFFFLFSSPPLLGGAAIFFSFGFLWFSLVLVFFWFSFVFFGFSYSFKLKNTKENYKKTKENHKRTIRKLKKTVRNARVLLATLIFLILRPGRAVAPALFRVLSGPGFLHFLVSDSFCSRFRILGIFCSRLCSLILGILISHMSQDLKALNLFPPALLMAKSNQLASDLLSDIGKRLRST